MKQKGTATRGDDPSPPATPEGLGFGPRTAHPGGAGADPACVYPPVFLTACLPDLLPPA